MLSHRIPDPEDVRAMSDQQPSASKRSVYLDELAECLYQTAVLCGEAGDDPADDWTRLSPSIKAKYRFEATAALNRLNPAKRFEAELRAREQVADAHYGKAFHLLSGPVQRAIVFQNRTAIHTADRVLEGVFSELSATVALSLEPVRDEAAS